MNTHRNRKQTNKRKTIRRHRKHRKGGEKKVTDEEMDKCYNFCSTKYLDNYKKYFRKTYKSNDYEYLDKKTDKEIDELLKKVDMNERTIDCKQTYCNPRCPQLGKNKKTRYFCPICKKYATKAAKAGAITFCQHDSTEVFK
jgi:hypothetical protein